jgi:hypothetical protein
VIFAGFWRLPMGHLVGDLLPRSVRVIRFGSEPQN